MTKDSTGIPVEGEAPPPYRLFRSDGSGALVGDAVAAFDTPAAVLAHRRRADWQYRVALIKDGKRTSMTIPEFAAWAKAGNG